MKLNKENIRYSDLITTLRVVLVSIFGGVVAYYPTTFGLIPGLLLISFIFFTDTLDGIVARKRGEDSKYGAFYDIVGDRITEIALVIPFVYLRIASPLILIYFVSKGFLIDYLRFKRFSLSSDVPFKQLNNRINKFLVSSRFMRASYGLSKTIMIFAFYILIFKESDGLKFAAITISVFTVIVSLLRSLPAFIEYGKNQYFVEDSNSKV